MRRRDRLVIWPNYFDSSVSWKNGRRLSKKFSVRNVKLEEIYNAALDLNLEPEISGGKSYPKLHWERSGAVTVKEIGPKTIVLKNIARKILEKRVRR